MSKTLVTFTHNVVAPASGASNLLSQRFAAMAEGTSEEYVLSSSSWGALNPQNSFFPYSSEMRWDRFNKQLICLMKQAKGDDGSLHYFNSTTGIWTQVWQGWFSTDAKGFQDLAHPFTQWDLSSEHVLCMIDWYKHIRQWSGSASGQWTDKWDASAAFIAATGDSQASNGNPPWSLGCLPNAYPSGEEGFLIFASQRLFITKKDGTGIKQLMDRNLPYNDTGGYVASVWDFKDNGDRAFIAGGPSLSSFTNGVPVKRLNSGFNNPDPRATCELACWVVTAEGTGNPTLMRIQDAPCGVLGLGPKDATNSDRLVCVGADVYILAGDLTGKVWKFTDPVNNPNGTWVLQSWLHKTQTVFGAAAAAVGIPFFSVAISEYAGIVTLVSSDPAHNTLQSIPPRMFLHKVGPALVVNDTTPNAFTFPTQTGVTKNAVVESAAIIVSGINAAAAISVSGGEYSINGGTYTSTTGTVTNTQSVTVRHTTTNSDIATDTTTLTIGGVVGTFTTLTAGTDIIPDPFTITPKTGQSLSANVDSDPFTVSGINAPTGISVTSGTYSINGGAFTASAGVVNNGDSVVCRVVSSGSYSTQVIGTVFIGPAGDLADFLVTTASAGSSNFWDFNALTDSVAPAGWTTQGLPSGSWTWTVQPGITGADGKVVRSNNGGSASHANRLFNDAVGSVNGSLHTIEILARFQAYAGTPGSNSGILTMMGNTTDSAGYGLGIASTTTMRVHRYASGGNIPASVGSAVTILDKDGATVTLASATWYWARWKRETDGSFKAKIWPGAVTDEPSAWTLNTGATVDTTTTSGLVGLPANTSSPRYDYDVVSFGIDGTAPSS